MVQRINLTVTDPYHYYLSLPIYLKSYFVREWKNFIKEHNILHDCQLGLRAGRSQSMALLSLILNITTSFDANEHAVDVCMDIKNANYTIDHNILPKNKPLWP